MSTMTIATIGVLVLIVWIIYKAFAGMFGGRGKADASGAMICPHCGTRGKPTTQTRGNLAIEIVLWLCFILPGLIYSLWRLSTRQPVCPVCHQPGMISVATPRGAALAQQFQHAKAPGGG
jgi:hypothetical protein